MSFSVPLRGTVQQFVIGGGAHPDSEESAGVCDEEMEASEYNWGRSRCAFSSNLSRRHHTVYINK